MVSSISSSMYAQILLAHLCSVLIVCSIIQMIAKSCPEFPLTSKETLVAISGAGNVGQFTALKVIELGATVVSLSDSKGALISETGFTKELVEKIGELKLKGGYLESLASEAGYTYHAGESRSSYLRQLS